MLNPPKWEEPDDQLHRIVDRLHVLEADLRGRVERGEHVGTQTLVEAVVLVIHQVRRLAEWKT